MLACLSLFIQVSHFTVPCSLASAFLFDVECLADSYTSRFHNKTPNTYSESIYNIIIYLVKSAQAVTML